MRADTKIDVSITNLSLQEDAMSSGSSFCEVVDNEVVDLASSDSGSPERTQRPDAPGPSRRTPETEPDKCMICWHPFGKGAMAPVAMECCHAMCVSCREDLGNCPQCRVVTDRDEDTVLDDARGPPFDVCTRCGKKHERMFVTLDCGHVFCKPCKDRPGFECCRQDRRKPNRQVRRIIYP